eukprot:SAG11_NODE_214_length_12237_cov_15.921486_13_plen_260_part_00
MDVLLQVVVATAVGTSALTPRPAAAGAHGEDVAAGGGGGSSASPLAMTVESVVRVAQSRFNRADPVAASFPSENPDEAMVLCGSNADNILMISTDGGRSFEQHVQWVDGHVSSSLDHIADIANNLVGDRGWRRTTRGDGVPQGYQKHPFHGPWVTNRTGIVVADWTARNVTFHTDETASIQAHWSAPAHELVMFSLGAGGVTALDHTGQTELPGHCSASIWHQGTARPRAPWTLLQQLSGCIRYDRWRQTLDISVDYRL